MTPAELELFADRLANAVADRLANRPRLVDRVTLSEITTLSVPTIDRRRRDGSIPSITCGSRVLFDLAAVIRALTAESGPKCCRCGQPATHLHDGKAYCELCRGCYDEDHKA